MNLNDIQLPSAVIADLYKKSLIELPVNINAVINSPKEVPTDPFGYMGNNLKQILIVVNYPDQAFLPDEQLRFLTAVLKACNLTLEDTAIVNFATFKPDYELLRQRMLPRIMLFFGVNATLITIPGRVNEFEPIKLEGITILHVPELEWLNQNNNEGKTLKKKLWAALKHLFDSTSD